MEKSSTITKNKSKIIHIVSMIAVGIIIAVLFFLIGYKVAYDRIEDTAASRNPQTFYATITDIQDHSVAVKGLDVNDINYRGEFTFPVTEETKIVWRYTDIAFEDLDVGDRIAVTFSGEIMESYPAQIRNVEQIQLLDDEI